MSRKKPLLLSQPISSGKAIKVRLDARTVVTLANIRKLDFWKQRYPDAQVIQ